MINYYCKHCKSFFTKKDVEVAFIKKHRFHLNHKFWQCTYCALDDYKDFKKIRRTSVTKIPESLLRWIKLLYE